MIKKPMLAATLEDIKTVKYPVLCTPKLDGIRCLIVNLRAVTRNLKLIPNNYVRNTVEFISSEGFDGEIIIPKSDGTKCSSNEVNSAVMSEDGEPDFIYVVFDYHRDYTVDRDVGYNNRMRDLSEMPVATSHIKFLFPVQINNESELLAFEANCLSEGYEGIILRSPNGPYKFGRSTLKEGYLMKFKRFTDGEAIIEYIYEKMHNSNEATIDELGHTKRSSHLAGQIPAGTLGGFCVRDIKSGQTFNVGTGEGLTDELRAEIWNDKASYIGKILKYKSQKSGEKDKPRFPIFIGFRDERDM